MFMQNWSPVSDEQLVVELESASSVLLVEYHSVPLTPDGDANGVRPMMSLLRPHATVAKTLGSSGFVQTNIK